MLELISREEVLGILSAIVRDEAMPAAARLRAAALLLDNGDQIDAGYEEELEPWAI